MLFLEQPNHVYVLRFMLGVFEAGFAPGMIFTWTYWYSGERMARVMAFVMLAGPLAAAAASACVHSHQATVAHGFAWHVWLAMGVFD